MVIFAAFLFAHSASAQETENYEALYNNLKTTVYNDTVHSLEDVFSAYDAAKPYATNVIEEAQLEYLLGFYYLNVLGEIETANEYFVPAMDKVLALMKTQASAEGYTILVECLAQYCSHLKKGLVSNALKVPKYAKLAKKINPQIAGATYIQASFSVYAPGIFCNLNKGRKLLLKRFNAGEMDNDDYFNYCMTLGYISLRKKKYEEAEDWHAKAEAIYPHNSSLMKQKNREVKMYQENFDTSKVEVAPNELD